MPQLKLILHPAKKGGPSSSDDTHLTTAWHKEADEINKELLPI
jgi:hypothetical protein